MDQPVLFDRDEVIRRVDASNKALVELPEDTISVANASHFRTPVKMADVKFDGSTERNMSATSEEMKNRIASCREAYEHAGIFGNAIDLMVDFALAGFDIVHHNPAIQNFYRSWANIVQLDGRCKQILKCFFRDGNVPILSYKAKIKEREVTKIQKAVANKENKKINAQSLFGDPNDARSKVIPYAYHILDVLNIERYGSEMIGNTKYAYKISTNDLDIIKNPGPNDLSGLDLLRKAIGDGSFDYMRSNGYLPLDPDRLSMLYYKKDDYRSWANPMFWRVINDLKYKKLLRDMDISVCESVINTLIIVKLGDTKSGFPATPELIAKMSNLLKNPTKSKTLIWNDLIDLLSTYPPVEKILGKEKYEQVDADIRAGYGIAEVVLNGQGNNYSNSFLSVRTLMERLEDGRGELLTWLEGQVRLVAKAMGFRQPPWFKMHHMSLRDEEAEKRMILELVDRGMVSYETCVDRFGENFQIEVERMKREDDFRRKNEKKYPYVMVKTGKFGPLLNDGPLPVFELLDSESIDNIMVKRGTKESPTQQGGQGQKGGRPQGSKKPQKKKETPRNEPKGQKTAASIKINKEESGLIFDKVFDMISSALVKARKVKDYSELEQVDIGGLYANTIRAASYFDNHKSITNKELKKALSTKDNDIGIVNTYSDFIVDYFDKHNTYPSIESLRDFFISICCE